MRRRMFLGGLIALLFAIPAVVYASHQFTDVSSSNTFHGDISWLADNGITFGCNPPYNSEFCPDDGVTRAQMAAFMKRFHDRFITDEAGGPLPIGLGVASRSLSDLPSTGNGYVPGLTLTLSIPESGALLVTASADTFADTIDAFACGISVDGSSGTAQGDSWRSVDLTANWYETCSTATAIPVNPGTRTVGLVVGSAEASTEVRGDSLTAVLYTNSGFFGLLSELPEETEPPELLDIPKGG